MNIFEKIFIRIKLKHIPVWSISPFLMPEKIFFFNFCKYNFDNHDAKITFSIYKAKNISVYTKYGLLVGDIKDFVTKSRLFKFVIHEGTTHCLEKIISITRSNILDNKKEKFLKLNHPSYIVNNPSTIIRKNYGHFIDECYLNILLILFSGVKKINLLYSNDINEFEKSHLIILKKIFNNKINLKIINLNIPIKIRSETYIVSTYRFRGGNFVRHPIGLFKDVPKILISNKNFIKTFKKKEKKIILISRSHNKIIKNIKEIKNKIPEIEIYDLSKISVKKQIELFYNAKIIIGTFDCGLKNLIFSKNNLKFVYLRPKNYRRSSISKSSNMLEDEYHDLAKTLNIKVYTIDCDFIKKKDGSNIDIIEYKEKNYFTVPTFKGSNFTVNVNKLNKIIKKIK